ncbi:hypothetical protein L195_g062001, partial [Trifolium pratense]
MTAKGKTLSLSTPATIFVLVTLSALKTVSTFFVPTASSLFVPPPPE